MKTDNVNSIRGIDEQLDWISTQIELEDCLAKASHTMEMHEKFDRAQTRGEEYALGYREGFWAGHELDVKYQLAKIESIAEKQEILMRKYTP